MSGFQDRQRTLKNPNTKKNIKKKQGINVNYYCKFLGDMCYEQRKLAIHDFKMQGSDYDFLTGCSWVILVCLRVCQIHINTCYPI